jgi:hypothetical protein
MVDSRSRDASTEAVRASEAQRKKDNKESGKKSGAGRDLDSLLAEAKESGGSAASSYGASLKADRVQRRRIAEEKSREEVRAQACLEQSGRIPGSDGDKNKAVNSFNRNVEDIGHTADGLYDKIDSILESISDSPEVDGTTDGRAVEVEGSAGNTPTKTEGPLTGKSPDELAKLIVSISDAADKYMKEAASALTAGEGTATKGAIAIGMQPTARQLVAAGTNRRVLKETLDTVDRNESAGPYRRSQYSFTGNLNRLAGVWSVGTNASQEPPDPDDERFWRDMKDCIPCMQWTWGDTDVLFGDLQAIFKADLDARISIFIDLKSLFEGNPILDELCQISKMFQNLCPQDLLALIAMLIVRTIQLLQSMRIDIGGMLKDIISTFLRPTISGLSGFLNMYATFLWDQVDCILNIIQTTSEVMSAAHVATPWADDKKNWLDSTAESAQEADDWVRGKAIPAAAGFPDEITKFMIGSVNKSMTYLADNLDMLLDTILEFCRVDFVKSDKELGFQANLMAVATMMDIAKIFYDWSKMGSSYELCSSEGAEAFIDLVNRSIPNVDVVNIDEAQSQDEGTPRGSLPRGGRTPGSTTTPTLGSVKKAKVEFSIKSCLNTSNSNEADLLSKWAGEL